MVGDTGSPTVIEGIIDATTTLKLEKAWPVVVNENNRGNTKITNTELESSNTLGVHIVKEKEGWF